MKRLAQIAIIAIIGFVLATGFSKQTDKRFLVYTVDLQKQDLRFFWKDDEGKIIHNFKNLHTYLHKTGKKLIFAMNGGMYLKGHSPQGLYVENGKILKEIDTVRQAYGNFYMQPNGIFYITKNINGKMHPRFIKGSNNLNIRNGVGILPDGKILFVMSKEKVNFYDFATFFQSQACKNALYLDGFVSKTYLPKEDWIDTGGNFGVLIAEIKE